MVLLCVRCPLSVSIVVLIFTLSVVCEVVDAVGSICCPGDTGVDADSCFFHDPAHPVPVNRVDRDHRKIISYITSPTNNGAGPLAEMGDNEGHGTHTAGSLAGQVKNPSDQRNGGVTDDVLNKLREFNGLAFNAKLVIFDFQNPRDNNLYVPNNIYSEYLTRIKYEFGAYVTSNSWGDDIGVYDSYTQSVDAFLYDNRDFLMLLAAGNDGAKGMTTIGTPACSKNVITVGASLNDPHSFFELGYASGIKVESPEEFRGHPFPVTPAAFGPRFYSEIKKENVRVVIASPLTACAELQNEMIGAIVITQRGECKFYDKARRIQEKGGVAMICVNSDKEPAFTMDTEPSAPNIRIPSVMVALDHFGQLLLDPSRTSFIRLTYPEDYITSEHNENRLSVFSSKGPTQDGRLKPDVVCPGEYIRSAHSTNNLADHQCADDSSTLEAMQGTSMATPICAATATLARQYFVDGLYRNPVTRETQPLIPSSALLKAVMIHSAQPISGSVRFLGQNKPIDVIPPPSYFQGHGRVQLDRALAFERLEGQEEAGSGGSSVGLNGAQFMMWINDTFSIASLEQHHFCFRVRQTSSNEYPIGFNATIAWTDPPPLLPANFLLVNDLDLFVIYYPDGPESQPSSSSSSSFSLPPRSVDHRYLNSSSFLRGEVWVGNERHDGSALQWDVNNNAEKVMIPDPASGLYRVTVRASHVAQSLHQIYAIIVTGDYDILGDAECPHEVHCPNHCSGHGRCWEGEERENESPSDGNGRWRGRGRQDARCICDAHFAAADCSVESIPIEPGAAPRAFIVPANDWRYFTFSTSIYDATIRLHIVRTSPKGDPDIYLTAPGWGYPTLSHYNYSNTECDPCGKTDHIIEVKEGGMRAGVWMIGIWGYCCEENGVTVEVIVTKKPNAPNPDQIIEQTGTGQDTGSDEDQVEESSMITGSMSMRSSSESSSTGEGSIHPPDPSLSPSTFPRIAKCVTVRIHLPLSSFDLPNLNSHFSHQLSEVLGVHSSARFQVIANRSVPFDEIDAADLESHTDANETPQLPHQRTGGSESESESESDAGFVDVVFLILPPPLSPSSSVRTPVASSHWSIDSIYSLIQRLYYPQTSLPSATIRNRFGRLNYFHYLDRHTALKAVTFYQCQLNGLYRPNSCEEQSKQLQDHNNDDDEQQNHTNRDGLNGDDNRSESGSGSGSGSISAAVGVSRWQLFVVAGLIGVFVSCAGILAWSHCRVSPSVRSIVDHSSSSGSSGFPAEADDDDGPTTKSFSKSKSKLRQASGYEAVERSETGVDAEQIEKVGDFDREQEPFDHGRVQSNLKEIEEQGTEMSRIHSSSSTSSSSSSSRSVRPNSSKHFPSEAEEVQVMIGTGTGDEDQLVVDSQHDTLVD